MSKWPQIIIQTVKIQTPEAFFNEFKDKIFYFRLCEEKMQTIAVKDINTLSPNSLPFAKYDLSYYINILM